MKKILGRVVIVLPAIALQLLWFVLVVGLLDYFLQDHLRDIRAVVFTAAAYLLVLILVSKREESTYKMLWVMVIMGFPIFGSMMYLTLGNQRTGKKLKNGLRKASQELFAAADFATDKGYEISVDDISGIKEEDLRIGQTLERLSKDTNFPVLPNCTSKYYPFGEDMFKDMCKDLNEARKYVYIEYFIIQSGKFWDTLVDILALKAANGVDVRVMYDDLGSIGTYSKYDVKKLEEKGISCIAFNPFLFIKSQLNNRDHRKIMVIDGKVAYSGGVNIADEYINEKEVFGRWKDIGFRLTGPAVWSYTYMFAEFWNAFAKEKIPAEVLMSSSYEIPEDVTNGYILPFYDSPMRTTPASNTLFTEVLSIATDYVWFYTPYLMLGDALFDAFIRAAQRGIDVRIIMPGIPDKKLVYRLGRSYYEDLLKAGVKIYEYTPGFVHAKGFIMDDKLCGIGTVNLDYRSLFLHFECSSIFYKSDIIQEIKADYTNSLSECRERYADDIRRGFFHRLIDSILRLAAPLL